MSKDLMVPPRIVEGELCPEPFKASHSSGRPNRRVAKSLTVSETISKYFDEHPGSTAAIFSADGVRYIKDVTPGKDS